MSSAHADRARWQQETTTRLPVPPFSRDDAIVKAAGNFTLAYMSPSSRWAGAGWVYILAADAPTGLELDPVQVKGVGVTIGQSTDLGVLVAGERGTQ